MTPPPSAPKASWRSPEIVGELVLLGVIAALGAFYFFQTVALPVGDDCAAGRDTPFGAVTCILFGWAPGAAEALDFQRISMPGRWLPLIAMTIGAPLWVIRLYTVLGRRKAIRSGMIMDLGFRLGEDPQAEKRRAALYFGSLVGLVLLVWLIGFHAGLPLWVFAYLVFWTRMWWPWALLIAAAFEAFIVGVLDMTVGIFWYEPLLFRWIGVAYPANEWLDVVFQGDNIPWRRLLLIPVGFLVLARIIRALDRRRNDTRD